MSEDLNSESTLYTIIENFPISDLDFLFCANNNK